MRQPCLVTGWRVNRIAPVDVLNDVVTMTCFLHYWPCVRVIRRSTMESSHKGPVMQSFNYFVVDSLNTLLNKQSICRNLWRPVWWHPISRFHARATHNNGNYELDSTVLVKISLRRMLETMVIDMASCWWKLSLQWPRWSPDNLAQCYNRRSSLCEADFVIISITTVAPFTNMV